VIYPHAFVASDAALGSDGPCLSCGMALEHPSHEGQRPLTRAADALHETPTPDDDTVEQIAADPGSYME
jgi:hypothetical protein